MNSLFILSSAINSKFGKFTPAERLQQTLDSIASVKQRWPSADICVVEMTGVPIPEEQIQIINAQTDYFFDCTREQEVIDIYNSTDNWDIVKNTTEVMCFTNVLTKLLETGAIAEYDRVFKMSGRYLLTENFDPAYYESVTDRIVMLERKHSQFPPEVTGGKQFQYMSRLWSFDAFLLPYIKDTYLDMFNHMSERLNNKGYIDIEHLLFHHIDVGLVENIGMLGVQGNIAPNGVGVSD
jgi:hypothetical protein